MSSYKIDSIPEHVANRILSFFNSAWQVSNITNSIIRDDPSDGPGNTIGSTLAARILRTRRGLPTGRFTNLEELDGISGFGTGTWEDLVYTFSKTAAETFRENMYENQVIYKENWPLWLFQYEIEDKETFQKLAYEEQTYRTFIGEQLAKICEMDEAQETLCTDALERVQTTYIDTYTNSTPEAAHAFALWFFRYDADNWFSYDRVFEQTEAYFSHYPGDPWEMDLRFFKGIPSTLIEPGITVDDLATVVNFPEQTITIWMSTLYD